MGDSDLLHSRRIQTPAWGMTTGNAGVVERVPLRRVGCKWAVGLSDDGGGGRPAGGAGVRRRPEHTSCSSKEGRGGADGC